jgi:hypothetical protein
VQPLLLWKSNEHFIFWMYICSPSYPTCNAYAPYLNLWSDRLLHICPHFLITGTIFGEKKVVEHKMCFDFLYSFIWNISHSKKKWARYDKKCTLVFKESNRYSCQILMKIQYFSTDFRKYSNISFHKNPSSGEPRYWMRKERQTGRSQ